MTTLDELALTVGRTPDHPEWGGTDKGVDVHNYLVHYERILAPLRWREIRLLEVGVCGGGGLRVWAAWMPNAYIDGVEIDATMVYDEPPRIKTFLCDVNDFTPTEFYDVIIDDGSHVPGDVGRTFTRLWPHLKLGGLYFIEDVASDPSKLPPHERPVEDLLLFKKHL